MQEAILMGLFKELSLDQKTVYILTTVYIVTVLSYICVHNVVC